MSKTQKDVSVGKAVIFFAIVTVLAFISGSIVPLWSAFGIVFAVITMLLALLWWINIRNGRRV